MGIEVEMTPPKETKGPFGPHTGKLYNFGPNRLPWHHLLGASCCTSWPCALSSWCRRVQVQPTEGSATPYPAARLWHAGEFAISPDLQRGGGGHRRFLQLAKGQGWCGHPPATRRSEEPRLPCLALFGAPLQIMCNVQRGHRNNQFAFNQIERVESEARPACTPPLKPPISGGRPHQPALLLLLGGGAFG
jgi:hypothetical protein